MSLNQTYLQTMHSSTEGGVWGLSPPTIWSNPTPSNCSLFRLLTQVGFLCVKWDVHVLEMKQTLKRKI